jgi:hypothetical protein
MNNLINLAKHIPTPEATLTVAYTPIRLSMPGRRPLELRLTAPGHGDELPIVLLSHGYGPSNCIPSKDAMLPLVSSGRKEGLSSSSRRMRVRGSVACRRIQPARRSSGVSGSRR